MKEFILSIRVPSVKEVGKVQYFRGGRYQDLDVLFEDLKDNAFLQNGSRCSFVIEVVEKKEV